MEPRKTNVDEVFLTLDWSLVGSIPLALRWSLLGSLRQQAAVRLAALCRCGRCGGPRRWSFSAGARAGPPVARSARHASMLLALPDRGSPWEPSRDCLPDEIADEMEVLIKR